MGFIITEKINDKCLKELFVCYDIFFFYVVDHKKVLRALKPVSLMECWKLQDKIYKRARFFL